jgi:ketosteroid isomerase-like protein
VLKDADRKFAAAAGEKGLDGWMGFMAEDAVRVRKMGEKAAVGRAAVRKVDAAIFADPTKRLVWEPTDAGLFADGKTGYTTGRSQVVTTGADGKEQVVWSGAYLTWWRKEADGSWKVILDTGVSDPPAAKK